MARPSARRVKTRHKRGPSAVRRNGSDAGWYLQLEVNNNNSFRILADVLSDCLVWC